MRSQRNLKLPGNVAFVLRKSRKFSQVSGKNFEFLPALPRVFNLLDCKYDNESEARRFQRILGQSACMFSVWLQSNGLGFVKSFGLLFWSLINNFCEFCGLMDCYREWSTWICKRKVCITSIFSFCLLTAKAKFSFRRQIRVSRQYCCVSQIDVVYDVHFSSRFYKSFFTAKVRGA